MEVVYHLRPLVVLVAMLVGRDLVVRRVRTLLVEWVVSLRRHWAALHRALVAQVRVPVRQVALVRVAVVVQV